MARTYGHTPLLSGSLEKRAPRGSLVSVSVSAFQTSMERYFQHYPRLGSSCCVVAIDLTDLTEAYNIMKSNGSDIDAGRMLSTWIKRCPELENIGYKTYLTPIGPWDKCECPVSPSQ